MPKPNNNKNLLLTVVDAYLETLDKSLRLLSKYELTDEEYHVIRDNLDNLRYVLDEREL